MASIRKKATSAYWFACFSLPDGRRVQRSTKTTDRRLAKKLADQFESAAKSKMTATQARKIISDIHREVTGEDLARYSVQGYLDQWIAAKKGTVSASTLKAYESAATGLCKSLGARADADLMQVNPADVTAFRNSVAQDSSPSTANLRLKIVRIAFQQAWREGAISENPAAKVSVLRIDPNLETRRGFTLDELKILLPTATGEWKGLVLFGLYTGQRLGDLARLRWSNIDRAQETLTLSTRKTSRRQILPLAASLLRWIDSQPQKDSKSPLFPDSCAVAEKSDTVGTLSNQFQRLLARCGLSAQRSHLRNSDGKGRAGARSSSELSFHSLRHTATSLMKNAGISPALVQEFVGHDSKIVSANYTHIDLQSLRSALKGLPNLV